MPDSIEESDKIPALNLDSLEEMSGSSYHITSSYHLPGQTNILKLENVPRECQINNWNQEEKIPQHG